MGYRTPPRVNIHSDAIYILTRSPLPGTMMLAFLRRRVDLVGSWQVIVVVSSVVRSHTHCSCVRGGGTNLTPFACVQRRRSQRLWPSASSNDDRARRRLFPDPDPSAREECRERCRSRKNAGCTRTAKLFEPVRNLLHRDGQHSCRDLIEFTPISPR
jgi:hypothetical protein